MRRQDLLVRLKCLAIMLLFTHFTPWAMAQDSGSSAAEWVEITLKYAPRDSRSAISAVAYHNGQKVMDQLTRGAAFTIRIPKSMVPTQSSISSVAIEDILKRAINQNYAFQAATIVSLGDRRLEPSLPNEKFLRVQDILSAANKSELRWIGNEGEPEVEAAPGTIFSAPSEDRTAIPFGTREEMQSQPPASACLDCIQNGGPSYASSLIDSISSTSDEIRQKAIQEMYNYYSKSPEIQKLVDLAKKKGLYPKKARWLCFRHLKKMLQAAHVVSTYLEGEFSKNAGPALEAAGFKNIFDPESPAPFKSPKDAPQGAILVYEPYPNRNKGKGHVEVKLGESGQGGFSAQFKSENSFSGNQLIRGNRKLIGIYVK